MGRLRDFLLGPSAAETKAAVTVVPQSSFWLPGNPLRDDLPDADLTIGRASAVAASTLVYACMVLRAQKLAEAPLWIAEEQDGNEAWLTGDTAHPLSALLEQPNPDQPAADFCETLSWAMDLGPTLVVTNRDRAKRPASLYVFTYDQFEAKPGVVDGVFQMYGEFTVTDANGRPRAVDPADVLHFPVPGGISPVDAALAHVRISDTMRRAVKSSLTKSMRPGSVTTTDQALQDEQFQRWKEQLSVLYAGAENTGRNLALDAGAKFQQLAASLKDLELGPVQGDSEVGICQAFSVHPALVGAKIAIENSSGLSDSLKPALSQLYDRVVFPRWQKIETAFTAKLLRAVDPSPVRFVRFVKDSVRALQPDLAADVNVAQAAADIATIDERRAMIQLPPLPNGAGEVIATAARPQPADAAAAQQGTQPVKAGAPARETKALRTDAERAAYWQAFEAKAQRRVGAYETAANARFREERAGVLATLRTAAPKAAPPALERKADDPEQTPEERDRAFRALWELPYLEAAELQILADYAPAGPYAQAWADEMGTLLKVTMEGAAQEFTASVGVAFSMDDPRLQTAIRQRAAALVQQVTATTKAAITDAIATGKAEGLTIEQIAKRVEEKAFGAIAKARAQAIANTEVVGAINDSEWTAAQAADVFQSKRWIHTRRPGDRKYHDAHEHEGEHGGWVPMAYQYTAQNGQKFARPFAPGLPASEVVRCGCTLAFSDVEPAQAQEEG